MKARIEWLTEEQGGRPDLPKGPRYVTVARFYDEIEKYPKEAWSLVLEFTRTISRSLTEVADVSFLVDEAPKHLLHEGSGFDLFEGRKLVARGKVIGS